MITIELADHKGILFAEPCQREQWGRTLAEQHPSEKKATERLDFKSAGDGLQRIMRMEGFRDLCEGGGWVPLESGEVRFMLPDGAWRYVAAEELRNAIETCEKHVQHRTLQLALWA